MLLKSYFQRFRMFLFYFFRCVSCHVICCTLCLSVLIRNDAFAIIATVAGGVKMITSGDFGTLAVLVIRSLVNLSLR